MSEIQTARLIGQPLHAGDLEDLCLMHSDPLVMSTLGGVRNRAETEAWLRKNLDHWNAHAFGLWTFRDREGRFVGRCGIRRVQVEETTEVELAYALVHEFWNFGFATEMASVFITSSFGEFQVASLVALVDAANTRSRRVAERLDFAYEKDVLWQSLPTMLYRLHATARPSPS